MAGDSPSDIQNTLTTIQTAALGFRVKPGWAVVVRLTETARSPQLADIRRIEFCTPLAAGIVATEAVALQC